MMMYQAPPLYFPDGTDYDTIQFDSPDMVVKIWNKRAEPEEQI